MNHRKSKRIPDKRLLLLIDYARAFDCVDCNKLWKMLKEMEVAEHFTCLLRNLYAGQEVTIRTGHGTPDWFKIGKGVCQGCIYCHPAYLTSMQSTSCKMPAGSITSWNQNCWGNINNLRYAGDTTWMAESKEELKPLDEGQGREWKSWLKTQHSKN